MTLRELVLMAEGRGELAWTVASHVMATVASYQTGKVIQPWVFNPLQVARRKEAQVEVVSDITILKELFVDRKDLLEDRR